MDKEGGFVVPVEISKAIREYFSTIEDRRPATLITSDDVFCWFKMHGKHGHPINGRGKIPLWYIAERNGRRM